MSTIYQHTIITIATAAAAPSALAFLDSIMPIEGGGSRSFPFGRPLSAMGSGSATHYLISFVCTESERAAFDAANLDNTSGVTYWRCGNPDGLLARTNDANSTVGIGHEFGWSDALAKMGLQIIQPDIGV